MVITPDKLPTSKADWAYSEVRRELRISDGLIEGISPQVWEYKTNDMNVLGKWLASRTAKGSGRAARGTNELDAIRPTRWEDQWSDELAEIIQSIDMSLALQAKGIDLLDSILASDLITAEDLPEPSKESRKAPKI